MSGFPQWYPNSFLAPLEDNQPHLDAALGAVARAVTLLQEAGLARDRIVLSGFSQGACLAAEFAARSGSPWGGIVAFSGGLIGNAESSDRTPSLRGAGGQYPDKAFEYEGSLERTPVLLACSEEDPHIPLARLRRSEEVFRAMGAETTLRTYPGSAHTVFSQDVANLRELVNRLVARG